MPDLMLISFYIGSVTLLTSQNLSNHKRCAEAAHGKDIPACIAGVCSVSSGRDIVFGFCPVFRKGEIHREIIRRTPFRWSYKNAVCAIPELVPIARAQKGFQLLNALLIGCCPIFGHNAFQIGAMQASDKLVAVTVLVRMKPQHEADVGKQVHAYAYLY